MIMRRRHFLGTSLSVAVASRVVAAEGKPPDAAGPAEPPPDDEISRVCGLIARYLDREKANDEVYQVLITILRTETQPFPIPPWLEGDETWNHAARVELERVRKRAGIGVI